MLIWAAVLPAIILMVYVYKKDRIEKEPKGLILKLLILGALSTFPAMILEIVAEDVFAIFFEMGTVEFIVIDTFLGVAFVEEYCKYLAVRIGAWKNRAFNYRFDAIVYSVAAALGFAAFENLLYVADSGLETALMRAFTAVPGHAINGLTMGIYLAPAKAWELAGDKRKSKKYRRLALLYPTLEHGIYDAALELDSELMFVVWIMFVVAIDLWAFRAVKRAARNDQRL